MNQNKLMKAMGHLPNVAMADLDTAMVAASPSVTAAVKDRKCFHPDHGDPEIAAYVDPGALAHCLECGDDMAEGLIQSHKRILARSAGSGSWPRGCDPEFPDHHVATFYVNRNSFTDYFEGPVSAFDLDSLVSAGVWGTKEKVYDLWSGKSIMTVATDLYIETYLRVGILHKLVDDVNDANINIKMKFIPGNVIGYAYFNNGSCGDQVDHFLDSSYEANLRDFTQLLSHEGGHNNNLEHEFQRENVHKSVMSYTTPDHYCGFSTGEAPYQPPRDKSMDELIEYYDFVDNPFPRDTPDPPTDPVVPPQEYPKVEIDGVLFIPATNQIPPVDPSDPIEV